MIRVYDTGTGKKIGEITEVQLGFLMDKLEEESLEDHDYYLNRATIEMLEEEGGEPGLIEMLKKALGDREEIEIRWSRA